MRYDKHWSCCICEQIRELEVRYFLGGVTKIEMSCSKCVKKVFERARLEPKEAENKLNTMGVR